jgi:hypothetical protein
MNWRRMHRSRLLLESSYFYSSHLSSTVNVSASWKRAMTRRAYNLILKRLTSTTSSDSLSNVFAVFSTDVLPPFSTPVTELLYSVRH